jgi:hypothetical protein
VNGPGSKSPDAAPLVRRYVRPKLVKDLPKVQPFVIMRLNDWIHLFDAVSGSHLGSHFSPPPTRQKG